MRKSQRCDILGRQIIHCHSVLTATASGRSTTEGDERVFFACGQDNSRRYGLEGHVISLGNQ